MKLNQSLNGFIASICAIVLLASCGTDDPVVIPTGKLNATADKEAVLEGESVVFTDESTNASGRVWTFAGGDITTSTEKTATVTYATAGTHKATIVVTFLDGKTDTKDFDIVVSTVKAGVLKISSDTTKVVEGGVIAFKDESTEAASRVWTFEGGNITTSTEANVNVTYATAGEYKAIAKVTFNDKTVKSDTIIVTVETAALAADFSADKLSVDVGDTVTFTDKSLGGPGLTYLWTFEGGTPATSTDPSPTVVYDSLATFDVTLVVTRTSDNATDTKLLENYITVEKAIAVNLLAAGNVDAEAEDISDWTAILVGGDARTDRLSRTDTLASGGTHSFKFEYRDANGVGFGANNAVSMTGLTFTVAEAGKYKVSADILGIVVDFAGGGGDERFPMNIEFWDNTTNAKVEGAGAFHLIKEGDDWLNKSLTSDLQPGTYYVTFVVWNPPFAANMSHDLYFDNVFLEKVE